MGGEFNKRKSLFFCPWEGKTIIGKDSYKSRESKREKKGNHPFGVRFKEEGLKRGRRQKGVVELRVGNRV